MRAVQKRLLLKTEIDFFTTRAEVLNKGKWLLLHTPFLIITSKFVQLLFPFTNNLVFQGYPPSCDLTILTTAFKITNWMIMFPHIWKPWPLLLPGNIILDVFTCDGWAQLSFKWWPEVWHRLIWRGKKMNVQRDTIQTNK